MQTPESPYLDTPAAAIFSKLSPSWLEVLRVRGGGPPYRKIGRRVLYRLNELEAWIEAGRCEHTAQKAG